MPNPTVFTPEWSMLVPVDRVGAGPFDVTVAVPPGSLATVAARLGLPALRALRCRWTLRPMPLRDAIEGEGVLEATVTQDCVVTLEPFDSQVHERFIVRFAPVDELEENDDIDAPDELAYRGRALDLGDATVEQLALALDPFPRAPGAAIDVIDADGARAESAATGAARPGSGAGEGASRPNPFAGIAARRRPN